MNEQAGWDGWTITYIVVQEGEEREGWQGWWSPGQEWGPFLEILDTLDFPRQLTEVEEKGSSRRRAKQADERGPGDSGGSPFVSGSRSLLGSRARRTACWEQSILGPTVSTGNRLRLVWSFSRWGWVT